MVPFVEIVAPYNQTKRHGDFLYAPPQGLHLFHDGRFVGPFVYPYKFTFNTETFQRDYVQDHPLGLKPFLRQLSFTLVDLNLGYRLPVTGATIQLNITNLFDEKYRSFVGTPDIGRMAIVRLKYDL